jgi:hypothetical protein
MCHQCSNRAKAIKRRKVSYEQAVARIRELEEALHNLLATQPEDCWCKDSGYEPRSGCCEGCVANRVLVKSS